MLCCPLLFPTIAAHSENFLIQRLPFVVLLSNGICNRDYTINKTFRVIGSETMQSKSSGKTPQRKTNESAAIYLIEIEIVMELEI